MNLMSQLPDSFFIYANHKTSTAKRLRQKASFMPACRTLQRMGRQAGSLPGIPNLCH